MKNLKVCLAAITVVGASMAANAAIVTGRIVDPEGDTPLEYVNVVVKSASGKAYGAATDAQGNFTITNIPEGKYTITASFVGYVSTEQSLVVNRAKVNAGIIRMSENSNVLQEVEVKGKSWTGRCSTSTLT